MPNEYDRGVSGTIIFILSRAALVESADTLHGSTSVRKLAFRKSMERSTMVIKVRQGRISGSACVQERMHFKVRCSS